MIYLTYVDNLFLALLGITWKTFYTEELTLFFVVYHLHRSQIFMSKYHDLDKMVFYNLSMKLLLISSLMINGSNDVFVQVFASSFCAVVDKFNNYDLRHL